MILTTPINTGNAIDQIAFAIVFDSPFNIDFSQGVEEFVELFVSDLPNYQSVKMVEMNLDSPAASQSQVVGFEFTSEVNDLIKRPDWSLKVDQNSAVIVCRKFTDWKSIWSKAEDLFKRLFSKINLENNSLHEIVMQCADIFELSDVIGYEPADVFDLNSDYLPKQSINSGVSWHIFQGWYSDFEFNGFTLLNNLNITATLKSSDNHVSIIDHVIKIKKLDAFVFRDSFDKLFDSSDTLLRNFMSKAYEHNKTTMRGLLSEPMLQAIGLKV